MKFQRSGNGELADYVVRMLKIYPSIRLTLEEEKKEVVISFGQRKQNGMLVYSDKERHSIMYVSKQKLVDEFYKEFLKNGLNVDIQEVCRTPIIDFIKR